MGFKDIFGSNREKDELEDMETEAGEDKANKNRDEKAEFNALSCFGWGECKTDKWMKRCVGVWYVMISFVWFLFGAFTFAPITFISGKVNVFFKNKKKSIFCGIIIYAVIVVLVVLLFSARGNTSTLPVETSNI